MEFSTNFLSSQQQMRLAEIEKIMKMLNVQQKECKCELFAYRQVRFAYSQYQMYLKSVQSLKANTYKANAARVMSLKFLRSAMFYKKRAAVYQATSHQLAERSTNQQSQYAMYSHQSKQFLSQYQMVMKKQAAMKLMMSQLMKQAMSFRQQYMSYSAKAQAHSSKHDYRKQSRAYY